MRAVWKFEIPITPWSTGAGQVFQVPKGALFRAVAAQGEHVAIWMEVDPGGETEERWFRDFGTGYALEGDNLTYLGTCLFSDGALVLHVYEVPR
jgi:hypothetical protein